MNDKPETKIGYISPLKRICMTIGELPSSYLETMTYYEMLVWFVEFLRNQVIPVVNNNSEATKELQNLFVELQDYVNNYFDSVDFQTMVDEKLESMVTDGTLEELINQDLFNNLNKKLDTVTYTKSKLAERIIEGTPTKVLFTGDSLTFGQVPSGTTPVEHPYPDLIQSFIREWYNDNTLITCLNYGVRGAIATNANNNFNTYLAQNPDTIIWAYGTNDVTQLRSNDTIISNLESFYNSCIDNNIELIVIIPGPNFINVARNQGMRRLHDALLNYCKSRGIIYVDMFEYMNNFYSSLSNTHAQLQTDGTHFIEYSVFRDCFITTLFPIVYKQKNKLFNYVEIDNTPNYVITNIGANTITGGVNPFYRGLVVRSADNQIFKMNFLLTKPSYLILNGFTNNQAGEGTFTIDGVDYNINQNSTATGTTSMNNKYDYKFPVLLNAGIHTISLKSITFDESQSRLFLFGFTIEEYQESISKTGYYKAIENIQAWSGQETTLTDEPLSLDLSNYNKMLILIGRNDNNFQYIEIRPVNVARNFYESNTFQYPIAFNNQVGYCTIGIDKTNNQINYSSTIDAEIRKVYLLNE